MFSVNIASEPLLIINGPFSIKPNTDSAVTATCLYIYTYIERVFECTLYNNQESKNVPQSCSWSWNVLYLSIWMMEKQFELCVYNIYIVWNVSFSSKNRKLLVRALCTTFSSDILIFFSRYINTMLYMLYNVANLSQLLLNWFRFFSLSFLSFISFTISFSTRIYVYTVYTNTGRNIHAFFVYFSLIFIYVTIVSIYIT